MQATISDKGPAAKALRLFEDRSIILYISENLLEEIRDVLAHPAVRLKTVHRTDEYLAEFLDRIVQKGTLIAPLPAHFRYERDPEDEHLINLAIEAKADYLVSRDKDLLALMSDADFQTRYPKITVLDPLAFIKCLESEA